jgi:Rap1a immunity proteins
LNGAKHLGSEHGKFYDAGQCRGYVSGVADIIVEKKTEACFTTDEAGPKVNQLVDIVRAYLRDHPEKRNLSADTLVIAALKEKFPCN